MTSSDFPEYHSYLLRLWLVQGEEGTHWRASLESAETGERLGFANLDAMFEHLRLQTRSDLRVKGLQKDDVAKFRI